MNYRVLFAVMVLMPFIACDGDYDKFQPYETADQAIEVLAPLKSMGSTIKLDPKIRNTVIMDDNILVEIPANAFVDAYGKLPEDKIIFSFHHLNKVIQYITYDLSYETIDKKLLNTKALFFVGAYSADYALSLNEGKNIQIKYPIIDQESNKNVFFPVDDLNEDDITLWKPASEINSLNNVWMEAWSWESEDGQINNENGYIINSTKLKWICVGEALSNEAGAEFEVELPDEYDQNNTSVYLISDSGESVLKIEWNEDRHRFCDLDKKIPFAYSGKVLVISNQPDDKLFFTIKRVDFQTDLTETLIPQLIELEDMFEIIKDL